MTVGENDKDKLKIIALKSFPADPGLVLVVDFLNKSLKEQHIMFGLTKDKQENEMTIHIYEF
ncbi:MAG: YpmA family protein [Syntrophomonadaceae bacterium]|nr:YpmA family protein [Syntrophomonadaceae bacterium]